MRGAAGMAAPNIRRDPHRTGKRAPMFPELDEYLLSRGSWWPHHLLRWAGGMEGTVARRQRSSLDRGNAPHTGRTGPQPRAVQYDLRLHHISTCFHGISTIERCSDRVGVLRCPARSRVVADTPSAQPPVVARRACSRGSLVLGPSPLANLFSLLLSQTAGVGVLAGGRDASRICTGP